MNQPQDASAIMLKILIVDDSPTQLYSLRKIVEQGGHQAVTVESGEEALEIAADEHPNVILMDIVMPGMSGYQAKRRLAKTNETCHIPVIFVSTKSGEADRSWGLRLGAIEYITKPVNPTALLTAISEAIAA